MSRLTARVLPAPLVLLTALAVCAAPKAARGEVLMEQRLSLDFSYGSIPEMPVIGPLELDWGFFARPEPFDPGPPPAPPYQGQVFDAIKLTSETVGQTFRLLPGDDPDFATFEGFLTNGREDWLYQPTRYRDLGRPPETRTVGSSMGGGPESGWLQRAGMPVDLAGYDITALTLRHESLAFVNQGSSTRITGAVTFTIEGVAVPEPAGLAIAFVVGACSLLKRRR